MRSLESGEEQGDWTSQRLTELKARRDRVIVEHVALRASLGEPRFQAFETFIQDWYNNLIKAPATGIGAVPVPAVKKIIARIRASCGPGLTSGNGQPAAGSCPTACGN
jgi:hypothetical protein